MAKKTDKFVVGLDIGTTKACAVVGEQTKEGSLKVIGIGKKESQALKNGVVVNMDQMVASIKGAVHQAERMSGNRINEVYVGISGDHIKTLSSSSVVAVKNKEISVSDVKRVMDGAKTVITSPERYILHIIPQEFIVDGQEGIKDPLGIMGMRLEAKVYIITGLTVCVQNIIKSCQESDLKVKDIILEPIASSRAVLYPEEIELGVALMDIGGKTTNIAIFNNGSIRYASSLNIGGAYITNDIALGLRTSLKNAEHIKLRHGCAYPSLIEEEKEIEIQNIGKDSSHSVSQHLLTEIVEARVEEICLMIKEELKKTEGHTLGAGLVITGGSSQLIGLSEIAEEIFAMPVRIGNPYNISGLKEAIDNPSYSTAAGLAMNGLEKENGSTYYNEKGYDSKRIKNWVSRMFNQAKNWLKESF
ncbi:MAG: cell division protein FtsA [Campylobacterota bacterium]|nr:cell division protein FtsA [Campylobacterota bacterium]